MIHIPSRRSGVPWPTSNLSQAIILAPSRQRVLLVRSRLGSRRRSLGQADHRQDIHRQTLPLGAPRSQLSVFRLTFVGVTRRSERRAARFQSPARLPLQWLHALLLLLAIVAQVGLAPVTPPCVGACRCLTLRVCTPAADGPDGSSPAKPGSTATCVETGHSATAP